MPYPHHPGDPFSSTDPYGPFTLAPSFSKAVPTLHTLDIVCRARNRVEDACNRKGLPRGFDGLGNPRVSPQAWWVFFAYYFGGGN